MSIPELTPWFPTLAAVLASAAYVLASQRLWLDLGTRPGGAGIGSAGPGRQALVLAVAALFLHLLALLPLLNTGRAVDLGLSHALSLVSGLTVLLTLIGVVSRTLRAAGMLTLPFAALMAPLPVLLHGTPKLLASLPPLLVVHVLLALVASAFVLLAAVEAILLLLREAALRRHWHGPLARRLPPLDVLDIGLVELLRVAWVLLGITLLSGFVFLEDLFAQHLVHKTVLSMASWITISVLLLLRWRLGLRGVGAARAALIALGLLVLGYFGSKLVLEWLLSVPAA